MKTCLEMVHKRALKKEKKLFKFYKQQFVLFSHYALIKQANMHSHWPLLSQSH